MTDKQQVPNEKWFGAHGDSFLGKREKLKKLLIDYSKKLS